MNLSDPSDLREFLKRHSLWARKGLGQHFLCSSKVVEGIVSQCMGCASVLEIGPGPGVLTNPLSQSHPLIALEIDDAMIGALQESAPNADVRKIDALKANLPAILSELPEPRAVVSNMPYYITGPLLTVIGQASSSYSIAVLMMQKEVGIRILAKAGSSDRGSLSVYLQALFEIEKVSDAPKGAFYPPPKVDSIVLSFRPKADAPPEKFFSFVRSSFGQPRKTLVNNLIAGQRMDREHAALCVQNVGLKETARPQELTQQQWERLYQEATKDGSNR